MRAVGDWGAWRFRPIGAIVPIGSGYTSDVEGFLGFRAETRFAAVTATAKPDRVRYASRSAMLVQSRNPITAHLLVAHSVPTIASVLALAAEAYDVGTISQCRFLTRGLNDTYGLVGDETRYVLRF